VNAREDFLSFNTCIRGLPPSSCGGKSWIGLSSCANTDVISFEAMAILVAADALRNSLLFIPLNINFTSLFLLSEDNKYI